MVSVRFIDSVMFVCALAAADVASAALHAPLMISCGCERLNHDFMSFDCAFC